MTLLSFSFLIGKVWFIISTSAGFREKPAPYHKQLVMDSHTQEGLSDPLAFSSTVCWVVRRGRHADKHVSIPTIKELNI